MEQVWNRRASDRILSGGVVSSQTGFTQGFTQGIPQQTQFTQQGVGTQQQGANPQQYSSDRQQQGQNVHGLPQIAGRRLVDQLSLMYSGLLLHNLHGQNVIR